MTARDILYQWLDEDTDRIAAHARNIAGDHPALIEATERIQDPRGPDGVAAPDLEHAQVFRTKAVADLLEIADRIVNGEEQIADPLEVKTVPELRQIAKDEGVEGSVSQMPKAELVDAINEKRSEESE